MRRIWLWGMVFTGLAVAGSPGYAQSSKATFPWSAALGGQLAFVTPHANAILLRARLDRSFDTGYNALDRREGGGQLERATVLGGYEWLLSERWSGGFVEKIIFDPGPTRTFATGGFLRHCGHIGSVQFRKRVLAEHAATSSTGQRSRNAGRIRLRADLDRTWRVGTVSLCPRLACEVQLDVALQAQDPAQKSAQRTIDRSVLRAELAVGVTNQLRIVPYLVRRTELTTAIAQYDADGNVKVPAGPRNLRFPVVGLDIRYTLPARGLDPQSVAPESPTFEGYQD